MSLITCEKCKFEFYSLFLSLKDRRSKQVRDRTFPADDGNIITCPNPAKVCSSQKFDVERKFKTIDEFFAAPEAPPGQGVPLMEWCYRCHVDLSQPRPREPYKWHNPTETMATFIDCTCDKDRKGSNKCPRDFQREVLTLI
eukprot:m.25031 g.25031  ORF g.25031 m.25031 type:complete len:141 (+) comp28717_c0_seq1:1362-1784(+)